MLWSIIEVLKAVQEKKIHVGLSNEGADVEMFRNCTSCDNLVRKGLKKFNKHHDVELLIKNLPDCDCKPEFISF